MTELPAGWAETTLSQIAVPDRPRELPSANPGLPFIGMEHVESQSMRLLATVPAAQMKSSSVHFQEGDVLYGRLRPYLNKVLVAQFEGLCSAEFIVFSQRAEINSSWLAYLLNSAEFVRFSSHLNTGDRPRVDFDQIGEFQLSLAPRPEQDRIVAEIEKQFTRLDAATAALKRVQANLKRYRASVLKAACEGRLVPTEAQLARKEGRDYEPADQLLQRILHERRARWEADTLAKMIASGKPPKDDRWKHKYKEPVDIDETDLPKLPEGWCWVSVDSIVHKITAGRSYKCEERPPDANEFGIVKVSAVTWGTFDETESKTCLQGSSWMAEYAIQAGDFLFSRANTIELVGACVIAGQIGRQLMLSDKILRFECGDLLLKKWLLIVLRSKWGRFEIERLSTGNQESMRNIGQDRIQRIRIPLAPPREIARIIAQSESSREGQEEVERATFAATRKALSVRQAILRDAFSGMLTEQNPSDEPASALLVRVRAERTAKGTSFKPRRKEGPVYA